jgi:hypothetical protein
MERITLSINTILINRQVKEANRGLPSLPMGATAFLYIHNQSQVGIILSFWTKYTGSTLLLSPVENYSCQETFVSRSPYAYKTLPVACGAGSPSV